MEPVFETRALTKYYGSARGAEDISLQVFPGEIFGFLGPNGSGKTTVMRSALGLLRRTSGEVRIFGDPVHTWSDLNHDRLGYLPADLRLWSRLSGRRISDLMLSIGRPLFARRDTAWRDELAGRLEINLDRRVKSLSLGNRQKIGLLLALQHHPRLLILDEPTSGLDPLVRQTVMEILKEQAARGVTVIYSSHNLTEVEQICSRIAILRRGSLVALKPIDEIRVQRERRLQFVFTADTTTPEQLPAELEGFTLVSRDGLKWEVRYHGAADPLVRWLAQYSIAELSSPQVSLEEAFLTYYRD